MSPARKMIYVCSPYSGDIEQNVENARRYCRYVVDKGHVPVAAHLLFPQFVSEEQEREIAMELAAEVLCRCDELWAFGTHISSGMYAEMELAKAVGMRVRDFMEPGFLRATE